MKIIYPIENDGVTIIHPTGLLPIEQVALKDVPYGVPYLIVDDSSIPDDRTYRAAWEADFSRPDGIGMGSHRWFIQHAQAAIDTGENVEEMQALITQMKAEVLATEGVQL